MIIVYGKNGCGACMMASNVLKQKGIEFEYKKLEDIPSSEADSVIAIATENKMMSMPIILKDGKQVTLKEVM